MLIFLNGRFIPEGRAMVSAFDRGFLYGDGLFETIRIFNGRPFLWERHLDRLRQGADFLKIKLPFAAGQLHSFALALVTRNKMPDCLLRLTLSRGVGLPGYSPLGATKPTLVMSLRPAPKINFKNVPQWDLIISSLRLAADDPLAGFKTLNKLPQVLARAEADAAGVHEALLQSTTGRLLEGSSANLFWINHRVIFTPPLRAGVLPGVTRAVVFEIASTLKIPLREKNANRANLLKAGGVFLSLTSRGIVEAKSLDGKNLSRSPLTSRLARAYNELLVNSCACNLRVKT